MELTSNEKARYARQIVLKDIGIEGQLNLKKAKIYVIGAGGLGSSLLLYLAAAGIGQLVIIDGDQVSLNNLQRQIIFNQNDIGLNKAIVAKVKLEALNELVEVHVIPAFLNEENMDSMLHPNTLIADCTDNFKTRYLINDYAVANNCVLVSAAVFKHQIQLGVYNFLYQKNERSATLRCAFPEEHIEDMQDSCAQTGVIGAVPGIAGMLMCNEIIKITTLSKEVQYNKIIVLDMHKLELTHYKIKRKANI